MLSDVRAASAFETESDEVADGVRDRAEQNRRGRRDGDSLRTEQELELAGELGSSGFEVRRYAPFPGWEEAIAYRETDGTLYVPDALGTAPLFTVGDERLGTYLLCRLAPPRSVFADVAPDRILVGHGTGIFEDATSALADALDGARRRFPAALVENGWGQLRALTAALGGDR